MKNLAWSLLVVFIVNVFTIGCIVVAFGANYTEFPNGSGTISSRLLDQFFDKKEQVENKTEKNITVEAVPTFEETKNIVSENQKTIVQIKTKVVSVVLNPEYTIVLDQLNELKQNLISDEIRYGYTESHPNQVEKARKIQEWGIILSKTPKEIQKISYE